MAGDHFQLNDDQIREGAVKYLSVCACCNSGSTLCPIPKPNERTWSLPEHKISYTQQRADDDNNLDQTDDVNGFIQIRFHTTDLFR